MCCEQCFSHDDRQAGGGWVSRLGERMRNSEEGGELTPEEHDRTELSDDG